VLTDLRQIVIHGTGYVNNIDVVTCGFGCDSFHAAKFDYFKHKIVPYKNWVA